MSDLLKAAVAYAMKGRRVFPCRDKRPLTPHGFKDATTNEVQIREWWRVWQDAWIGCPTGDGFFVLDVDPRHGGDVTLSNWESRNGYLPLTFEANTPGGGSHRYFKQPDNLTLRSRAGVLGPGVDVRADGGYVIVPPSPGYSWRSNGTPLEAAPEALLQALTEPALNERRVPGSEQAIPKGTRNNTLTRFAGAMRAKGMSRKSIEEALVAENAARCLPPLAENEVRRIAASVGKYPPGQASPALASGLATNPWTAARTASAFLIAIDQEADFLEPRLLARGSLTEWFSPRGLGKTHVAHAIAVRLAKAGKRVLIIDRDNSPRETRRRLRGWHAEGIDTLKVLTRDDAPPLTDTKAWQSFPVADFDLVIIDSLDSSTEGVGEQDSSRPSRAIAALLDVARQEGGPAVLVLGNVVKSGHHSRGSGVVEDRADVVYEVRDATGLSPSGRKPWFQELAPAGASEWQERASRRGRRDAYRLAFVATKFRIGEEPEPFVLEINLGGEFWTLRDATTEVDAAGQAAIAEKVRTAVAALQAAIEESAAPLLAERDGVPVLQEAGLTRDWARLLLKREVGRSWAIEARNDQPGRPHVLRSLRGTAEMPCLAEPPVLAVSEAIVSAEPSTQGPPKPATLEAPSHAVFQGSDLSAAGPCGYHNGPQTDPCRTCGRCYREHVWGAS